MQQQAAPAAVRSTSPSTVASPSKLTVEILVGPSGSGKSTYTAKRLAESFSTPGAMPRVSTVSADDFFEGEDGVYRFDPTKIGEAHAACLRDFIDTMRLAASVPIERVIVVDNTNTTAHEIGVYYAVAKAFGADVKLIHFDTHPDACVARSIHGASEATIRTMWQRARELDLLPYWQVAETVIVDHQSYAKGRLL